MSSFAMAKSFLKGVSNMKLAFRSKQLRLTVFAVAACLMLAASGFSQGIATGSLSGTVTDPTGAIVPGAKVVATNSSTGQEFTGETNEAGLVALRSLPPGSYKVTITSKNFRTVVLEKVEVVVAQDSSLGTIKLELGQVGDTIQVEAGTPIIETNTSQVTTSFSSKEVADLPLSGSFDALTLFIPGVADSGDNNFSNTNGAGFSSNGLRGRSNNFQIDGQSNNDNSVAGPSIFLGNQDALEEVSVITNDFSVEYGRASGSVVNYVTKSGGNDFHGSGFEYFLGSFADSHANEEKNPVFGFCAPGVVSTPTAPCNAVQPIPRYVENKFGGSIGGPIKRNKAWFFFTPYFDRTRQAGSPSTTTTFAPTPNGLTELAAAFPGNLAVAALNAIGPYAVKAGNPQISGSANACPSAFIAGNGPVCKAAVTDGTTTSVIDFAQLTRSVPSLFNDREFTGRVDVQVSSKDRIGARYIFQQNILTGATGRFAAGAWVDIPARDQQIALDWTHTFSGSFLNQTRYSFSRAGFGFEGGSFPNCTRASIFACPTGISLQGTLLSFGMQSNLPQGRTINNSQVQDNASITHGRHTFKFGGEFYKQRSPNTFLPNINGTYTFSGSNTGGSCATQFGTHLPTVNSTTCSFSRFLADTAAALSLTDGPPKFNFKEFDVAAYAGDDWQLKNNLTVNLGLRWEFSSQAINLLHALSVANQAGSNPLWSTTAPISVTTVPEIPNHYKYFGPSVGFAWKPHFFGMTTDKTVVRGGYRLTYDPAYYNIFLNVATSAPVVNAGTITTCTAPCLPTSGFLGSNVRAGHLSDIPRGVNPGFRNNTRVANNFREPYTQEWTLGVQHEFTSKVVLEVRYVGNHTIDNFQTVNANPDLAGLVANSFSSFIPAGVTPCATAGTPGVANGSARADCNFTNVRNRENTAWSRYNGLQNELRVQNWHGFSGAGSFTWSRTIDNSSEIFSTGAGGNSVAGAQNPFDISKGEKALSGLDFPKTASFYVIYELPWYKSQHGFLGKLLGGYQANTTYRYSTGQLWTPIALQGANTSCQNRFDLTYFSSFSTCRPFLGSASAPVDTIGECSNPAAADCGLVEYFAFAGSNGAIKNPVAKSAVHWIYNDNNAAAFFKTPYGNVARNPGVRGQNVSTVNFSMFKTTKVTERLSLRLEAQVYNLFNHVFLGVPDPLIDDSNLANGGSFGNNLFNSSGGLNPNGLGGYTNSLLNGLGRRRLVLGGKITF
jgi:Carboxypeptidase regulatory-like domain/TonB-dependent Receptor Plug Domain